MKSDCCNAETKTCFGNDENGKMKTHFICVECFKFCNIFKKPEQLINPKEQ